MPDSVLKARIFLIAPLMRILSHEEGTMVYFLTDSVALVSDKKQ